MLFSFVAVTVTGLLLFYHEVACAGVQTTYHWHLQQPIYWPAPIPSNPNQYQKAWQSMQLVNQQNGHPESPLSDIFGKADRVAVYQYRAANAIDTILSHPDAGAQVSYAGDLIENINSLAANKWNGYSPDWNKTYAQERQKSTSGGFPRMDLVAFPYHHALAPLVDPVALEKEIEIHKVIYGKTWGSAPGYSKGYFPAEMAFSERIIPTLVKQGIEWVFVSNNHLSRACSNYNYSFYGDNNNPPNRADQINPPQSHWFRESVSRGVTPNNAYPFSFTPHRAQHTDPTTGALSSITVVPVAQAMSWQDGYECYSPQDIEKIASQNVPNKPMLVVLAHDGDNAFGGGYTYYMQCVQQFVNAAADQGYNPTTVQQYLKDFPVDPSDIVHVEDGAWINADGDFGAPRFINWNWPLTGNSTNGVPNYDPVNGWQVNERNWAVITAAQNVVQTAEQVAGPVDVRQIQNPSASASEAELAWHFYLPALTSGYMYYGAVLDMPVKQTIACNTAVTHGMNAIKSSSVSDKTPPSIWFIMRQPYNPGGTGYGSLWKYKVHWNDISFWVYTFVYDVSGIKTVTLHLREDDDGVNPLDDKANDVYDPVSLGLNGVGAWQNFTMSIRQFPKGDMDNIHFYKLPTLIADEAYFQLTSSVIKNNTLYDYYVSAEDNNGNVKNSDIFHVYVGANRL